MRKRLEESDVAEREELEKEKLEKVKAEKKGGRIRVNMLINGGDCQALNTMMRGVAKAFYNLYDSMDIAGFWDGCRDLMYEDYCLLLKNDFSDIFMQGGTLLGTSRQPFKQMIQPGENGNNKVELMKATHRKLGFDRLHVLGGDGSQKTANPLWQGGLSTVSLPRAIDNDLFGMDETFSFQSAVEIASNVIDCIRTIAVSRGRISIAEVMGHKVGWLTLYAGITGDADIVLIPEVPYGIKAIIETLQKRQQAGSCLSIIVVAEDAISKETAALSKKERKIRLTPRRYLSAVYEIGVGIQVITGQEIRVTVPGHTQRGGAPNPYDRVFSPRLGARTAKLISRGHFGEMMVIRSNEIMSIPLEESVGKLKTIDPNSSTVEEAKLLGLSFGDR